jgi:hypothetical protein
MPLYLVKKAYIIIFILISKLAIKLAIKPRKKDNKSPLIGNYF